MKKLFAVIFAILAVVASCTTGQGTLLFAVSKSLLMPALTVLLLSSPAGIPGRHLILAALFFSWLGDVFLLFDSRSAWFFIGGLASFLVTHILYIIYFLRIRSTTVSILRNQPWMAALVAAYGVSLVMFLSPFLKDMKAPVMIYATVICSMVICSLHVFTKLNRPANILFLTGALLFAASDSLLAINKFYHPFPGAGIMILASYCAAQFLIVMGVTRRQAV